MIANPMTARESFDSFYTKKLDALKIELKAIIKGDTPYTVSATYACTSCQCRIFLHTCEGHILCMRCIMPPSLMPSSWSKAMKTDVFRLMTMYPSLEASSEEWEALQSVPSPKKVRSRARVSAGGDIELGKQIKEARLKLKLSKRELGAKIFKEDGKERMSGKSIEGYENGYVRPPEKILEQIKQILEIEGWQNWNDIERDLKG